MYRPPDLSDSWSPRLDHPLNRGLIFMAAFCENGGAPFAKGGAGGIASPMPMTKVGTATTGILLPAASGIIHPRKCANLPTNGDDWQVPGDPIPVGRVTYAFIRCKAATSTAQTSSFGCNINASANGDRAGGHAPYLDGTVYWDFGGTSGANRLTWGGYTPATNIEVWTFVAGSRGSAIYFNGLQKASQSTGITRSTNAIHVGVNTGNAITTSDPNAVLFFGAWNAEWTAAEAFEFYRDAYALLNPLPTRRLLNSVSAGGSFNPGWASGATRTIGVGVF